MNHWDADQQKWVPGPPADEPGSAPPEGPSHAAILAGVLAVVVLAGGIAFGTWALNRDDGDDGSPHVPPGASGGLVPGPTDTSTGLTSGGGSGTSGGRFTFPPAPVRTTPRDDAPAGFLRTTDPAGFRLDVPLGWRRGAERGSVFYRSPDGLSLIQVYVLDPPAATPYDSLVETRKYVSAYPGYRGLGITRVGGRGSPAEFAYEHRLDDGTTRHAVIHAYAAPDGRQYALLVAAPPYDWGAAKPVLSALVASFCPTGWCPA